jgi:hypothetical protein
VPWHLHYTANRRIDWTVWQARKKSFLNEKRKSENRDTIRLLFMNSRSLAPLSLAYILMTCPVSVVAAQTPSGPAPAEQAANGPVPTTPATPALGPVTNDKAGAAQANSQAPALDARKTEAEIAKLRVEYWKLIVEAFAYAGAAGFFIYKAVFGYLISNLTLALSSDRRRSPDVEQDYVTVLAQLKKGDRGALTLHHAIATIVPKQALLRRSHSQRWGGC